MADKIYLHRSIPLLFGVPSARASNWAVVISILVMAAISFAYILVDMVASFPFFHFTTALLLIHGATALMTTGANLLYIFRYMLVWILIFATASVFAIYGGEVLVHWFGTQYQTPENTQILLLAGVFSLCGSLIGWHVSLREFRGSRCNPFLLETNKKKRLRQVGYLLAFCFAILYVWKSGGILVGDSTYGNREEPFELTFGVFNIFHFTGIALLLLSAITTSGIQQKVVLLSVLTLVPGMLTGSRADFLPQAFIVLMLIANTKVVAILAKRSYLQLTIYFMLGSLTLAIGYLTASFIALWRTGIDISSVIKTFISRENGLLIQEVYDKKIIFLETGNMMLGGLYSAIVQVREGYTGFLYGESYLNYLIISPPAFLGLPRPLGLEWFTSINGEIITQGGIFEVAEAYWNFGIFGCFAVSFGLSYFFAWIMRRGVLHNNYFFLVWYFVFGIHGFRSIWYQNFSYFRLMTVMLVILGLSYLFFRWFSKDHAASRQKFVDSSAFT
jgi:hypothetical protein